MAYSNNSTEENLLSINHAYRIDSELPRPALGVDLSLTTTVTLTPRTQPKSNLEVSPISSQIILVAFDEIHKKKTGHLRWYSSSKSQLSSV